MKIKAKKLFLIILCLFVIVILFGISVIVKVFFIDVYSAEKKAKKYQDIELRKDYFYSKETKFMYIVNILKKYPSIRKINVDSIAVCTSLEKKIKYSDDKFICSNKNFDENLVDVVEIYDVMNDVNEIIEVEVFEKFNDKMEYEDSSIRFYLVSSFDLVVFYEYCLSTSCTSESEEIVFDDGEISIRTNIDGKWSTVFSGKYLFIDN